LDEVPEEMYCGTLPVAKKRKSMKKETSEADDIEEASEPMKKKAKKEKQAASSYSPTIQDEVQDLEPAKILNKRTRSGKTVGSSQPLPAQPSIPKKKRKHVVRKMKVSLM